MLPDVSALDRYIVAFNRGRRGYPALTGLPAPRDFLLAFAKDPALLSAGRDEVARLSARGGMRTLAIHDAESKVRHDTLVDMLAAFDAQQEKTA